MVVSVETCVDLVVSSYPFVVLSGAEKPDEWLGKLFVAVLIIADDNDVVEVAKDVLGELAPPEDVSKVEADGDDELKMPVVDVVLWVDVANVVSVVKKELGNLDVTVVTSGVVK